MSLRLYTYKDQKCLLCTYKHHNGSIQCYGKHPKQNIVLCFMIYKYFYFSTSYRLKNLVLAFLKLIILAPLYTQNYIFAPHVFKLRKKSNLTTSVCNQKIYPWTFWLLRIISILRCIERLYAIHELHDIKRTIKVLH